MAKKSTDSLILDTESRKRIEKQIGKNALDDIEEKLLQGEAPPDEIVETKTRALLRKKLGKEALEELERRLMNS